MLDQLLVEGAMFPTSSFENQCFLGVNYESKYSQASSRTVLGARFFDQYYAVFDQTPSNPDDSPSGKEESFNHIGLYPVMGELDDMIPCTPLEGETVCVRAVPEGQTYESWKEQLKKMEATGNRNTYTELVAIGISAFICICCLVCFLVKKRRDQMYEDQTFAQGTGAKVLVNEED